MATTLPVERIDILEGPNLDELQRAFKHAVSRDDGVPMGMSLRFEEVVFFGTVGDETEVREMPELGRGFAPKLVGIRYLGNDAKSSTRDDFVITVVSWTTLEGHYNTHSRKGSLSVLR